MAGYVRGAAEAVAGVGDGATEGAAGHPLRSPRQVAVVALREQIGQGGTCVVAIEPVAGALAVQACVSVRTAAFGKLVEGAVGGLRGGAAEGGAAEEEK